MEGMNSIRLFTKKKSIAQIVKNDVKSENSFEKLCSFTKRLFKINRAIF